MNTLDVGNLVQHIDLGTLALIAGGLCVVGVIAFIFVHVFGVFIGLFTGIFHGVAQIVAGGPVTWCGCLLAVLGCGACGLLATTLMSIYSSCGTAQAVNFCRIFGL